MSSSKRFKRMPRKLRKELLASCIISLAEEHTVFNITMEQIAELADCSIATLNSHFGGIKDIREFAIEHAVENNIRKILDTPITNLIKS